MGNVESEPELFEALDVEGTPTGELKTKKQIFADGDWRHVVHVWIVNSAGELLTQKRVEKGIFDNLWDVSVGGGVSAGEPPAQTAVRETEEELGVTITEDDLEDLGVWKVDKHIPEIGREAREFSHTFLVRRDVEQSEITLQEEEVADTQWRSLDEVEDLVRNDETYEQWVPHGPEYYLGVIAVIRARMES